MTSNEYITQVKDDIKTLTFKTLNKTKLGIQINNLDKLKLIFLDCLVEMIIYHYDTPFSSIYDYFDSDDIESIQVHINNILQKDYWITS